MPKQQWEPNWHIVMLALAILFFLQGARELIGSTYNSNLATMSINSSIIYVLGFLSPILFPLGIHRLNRKHVLWGFGIAAIISRFLISTGPDSNIYLFLSFILVSSILIFIRALLGNWNPKDRMDIFLAMIAAVCLDMALRFAGGTFDPSIYGVNDVRITSLLYFTPLASMFLYGLFKCSGNQSMEINNPKGMPLMGLSLGLALFVYMTISGFPNVIAGWTGAVPFAVYLTSAFFMAILVVLLKFIPQVFQNKFIIILSIIALLGTFAMLALEVEIGGMATLLPASILLFSIVLHNNIRYFTGGSGKPRLSFNMLVAGFVFVALVFISVLTLTWAHVPGTGFLKGTMGEIIFLAVLLFSIISLLPALRGSMKTAETRYSEGSVFFAFICMIILLCSCTIPAAQQAMLPASPQAPNSLRVMTYNIHQGYGMDGILDPWEILNTIQEVGPDILVLQESETNRISSMNVDTVNWLAYKLGMDVYPGPSTSEQIYGLALLSKFEIKSSQLHWLDSIEDQRCYFRCQISTETWDLAVYGVHLGLSPEDRTSQSNQIIQALSAETDPFIFMGDFNTWPNETIYTNLTDIMHDAWVLAGHAVNGPGTYTFYSPEPCERIDYIFVSDEFASSVISCEVMAGQLGSDHLPVWALLDFG
ncbi:MAG: endonuclease/exonuclease/phosphatase family protein [Thermoplasmata archaeon]